MGIANTAIRVSWMWALAISRVWSHTSGPKSCFHGKLLPCDFEAHSWFMFASDLFHFFFFKEKSFPLMQENLIMQ